MPGELICYLSQEGPCDARGNVNVDNDSYNFRSRPLKFILE